MKKGNKKRKKKDEQGNRLKNNQRMGKGGEMGSRKGKRGREGKLRGRRMSREWGEKRGKGK